MTCTHPIQRPAMRTAATCLYGLALGLFAAWTVVNSSVSVSDWLLLIAAVALSVSLLINQRAVVRSKGRRWRKTS